MVTLIMWTAQLVRDRLPDVDVLLSPCCRIHTRTRLVTERSIGWLAGRFNHFATLSVDGTRESYEVSWETLAHCLNVGQPVQL